VLKHPHLTRERVRHVYARVVAPAVHGAPLPLQVSAHHVRGEPITVEEASRREFQPFAVGETWGGAWDTTWLRLHGRIPANWAGARVAAAVDVGYRLEVGGRVLTHPGVGAEGLVWRDGVPVQGLSPEHSLHVVSGNARGGESIDLLVEAAANRIPPVDVPVAPLGMPDYGGPPLFTLRRADLVVVRPDVARFALDFRILLELMEALPDDDTRRARILYALNDVCNRLDAGDVAASVADLQPVVSDLLAKPAHASAPTLHAVGHAHLDTAWMWPLRETVRKCARTFSTATALMDEYPEYRFACSTAQHYAWVQEHYPALFARIREKIAAGQWEPVGGMWVEADCNLPSGESLVRQLLHGMRFFRDELGVETDVMWLPDVFGFPASLPQIMAAAGIHRFMTQKLSWNQLNRFPHHTFWWEGIDGTRVFAHLPPADTYSGDLSMQQVRQAASRFAESDRCDHALYLFGWGDGGGGPSRDMLERLRRIADVEGLPRVRQSTAAEFFDAAESEAADVPTWVGELYLELHRGTYTTQARIKQGNRRGEVALRDAEMWAALAPRGAHDWRAELDDAWKRLLLHQFHDIIPGSSIHWVYEDAARDHARVEETAGAILRDAACRIATEVDTTAMARPVVVFNSTSHERRNVIDVDGIALAVDVPACGYAAYDLAAPPVARDAVVVTERSLENAHLRVELDGDGLLVSVFDKDAQREVLAPGARGNVLQLFDDRPVKWDAWDVDVSHRETARDVVQLDEVAVESQGAAGVLRLARRFGASTVTQRMRLAADSRRVDFVTDVDWQESQTLLKVAFPVDVRAQRATYEIQFGHVERPTHFNTSWDVARFESCAQRWADLSETGYGVALLNDCKHGYDVHGNVLRLSLLRSPSSPDPVADRGTHRFTYALFPHTGDACTGGVIAAAEALNVPLTALPVEPEAGSRPASASFLSLDGPGVVVDAVKPAENGDGIVVRLHEAWGGRRRTVLRVPGDVRTAERTDLLEHHVADVEVRDGGVELVLRPFEIVTLRLRRAGGDT
jgi:alpha-mannosidase